MAASIKWSEAKIAQLEQEGRGKGAGADYIPWIQVNDFSSRGFSRRVFSQKTSRAHHLLSEVEWQLFLLLEFCPAVLDIREQFPLKRDATLSIAAEHGIRHPVYPGTHIPTVMTVDFLVVLQEQGGQVIRAFNCKRVDGIDHENELGKLEIERNYFDRAGVPHHLVFDRCLNQQKVENLEWCRSAFINDEGTYETPNAFAELHQRFLQDLSRQPSGNLSEFCANYELRTGTKPGTGLRIARALIWRHDLLTDLATADLAFQPAAMFSAPFHVTQYSRGV